MYCCLVFMNLIANINIKKKPKEDNKPGSKEEKTTKMVNNSNEYFYDIKRAKKIFDQLIHRGQIKLFSNHTVSIVDQIKGKKFSTWHD